MQVTISARTVYQVNQPLKAFQAINQWATGPMGPTKLIKPTIHPSKLSAHESVDQSFSRMASCMRTTYLNFVVTSAAASRSPAENASPSCTSSPSCLPLLSASIACVEGMRMRVGLCRCMWGGADACSWLGAGSRCRVRMQRDVHATSMHCMHAKGCAQLLHAWTYVA